MRFGGGPGFATRPRSGLWRRGTAGRSFARRATEAWLKSRRVASAMASSTLMRRLNGSGCIQKARRSAGALVPDAASRAAPPKIIRASRPSAPTTAELRAKATINILIMSDVEMDGGVSLGDSTLASRRYFFTLNRHETYSLTMRQTSECRQAHTVHFRPGKPARK